MELKITFTASLVVKGKNMDDIVSKQEDLNIFTNEVIDKHNLSFAGVDAVEDWENGDDLTYEFNNA